MSATIIPLRRWSKSPLTNIRFDAVDKDPASDLASAFHDGARVRLLLDGLRAQQDTLLSTIENLRAPSLRSHPDLGRATAALEAASVQALAEVGLLIRRGSALLHRYQRAEV